MIKLTVRTERARRKLEAVRAAISEEQRDRVVERAAFETLRFAVIETKKLIGVRPDGTRWNIAKPENQWRVEKPRPGTRALVNPAKEMRFLDSGTKSHGPVSAGKLYVPLRRRAAAGWRAGLKFGVDYVLTDRVRGMKATHVVDRIRAFAKRILFELMREHIKAAVKDA